MQLQIEDLFLLKYGHIVLEFEFIDQEQYSKILIFAQYIYDSWNKAVMYVSYISNTNIYVDKLCIYIGVIYLC